MVLAAIAWVHALRFQLRVQGQEPEAKGALERYVSAEDRALRQRFDNLPNGLHWIMGRKIYTAMANGTLVWF